MENKAASGSTSNAADTANGDGVHEQRTSGTSADEARREAMQRAEEMVDRLGEQIGHYATDFGHGVLKWFARAREEAEDIWAEAQAIRDQQRAARKPSEGAPPANR
jgi:hypothetical protein